MPLDASRNSLVLPMLGLLVEQRTHAYDLAARLRERYEQLPVTRSTVTTLLKTLEKAGLVTSRVPEQVGNRPPRTVYELTAAGLADFRGKVEANLREAQVASFDFVTAVAYVGILPAEEAASLLEARTGRLGQQLAELDPHPDGVPEVHMLEVAYWRAIVAAEVSWIAALAGRIRAQDIDWIVNQEGA